VASALFGEQSCARFTSSARRVKIFSRSACDDGQPGMKGNSWARILAYVTGLVNQELLLRNEYLAAENRILRAHLSPRLRLTDPERSTLAEIGKRLGRKALKDVACVAKPDTILAWFRRLIAKKFDGSRFRSYPGRAGESAAK
jgi:hypothetical protein